ncbi:MAG: CerR family C-terminal domain-containing protein [Phenylobacterium sp.]|nr:CerR family C-terminal domain-containing protein [Phenylobacterium sp.]
MSSSRPDPRSAGYRKGEETRARMLDVAAKLFGQHGFAAVTTRQIVEESEASLPTLNYYFGDKNGLYLACAEEIALRYEAALGETGRQAAAALQAPMTPPDARAALKAVYRELIDFMLAVEDTRSWALFIHREIAVPGPAHELLYSRLWAPGMELSAALIARAMGHPRTTTEAKVRAILLSSSLTAFQAGRQVYARVLGEGLSLRQQADVVARVIEEEIERLGA